MGQILEFLNLDPDRLDSLQPKFANTANDRRQEIAGLGSLRRTSLIRMMVQRLPSTWRNQWRHHLDRFTSKKLTPPQADISAELKDEFPLKLTWNTKIPRSENLPIIGQASILKLIQLRR